MYKRQSLYGGGAFLIPYIIFVILIGSTGVIGEMCFGRAARSGPIDAFGMATERKGSRKSGELLGMIPVLGSMAMAIGYTVVMGWILKYTVGTLTGATLAPESVDEFGVQFGSMASAFGNNIWQVVVLILCMGILMFGVATGIEKANKIMMPIFFASGSMSRIICSCSVTGSLSEEPVIFPTFFPSSVTSPASAGSEMGV